MKYFDTLAFDSRSSLIVKQNLLFNIYLSERAILSVEGELTRKEELTDLIRVEDLVREGFLKSLRLTLKEKFG